MKKPTLPNDIVKQKSGPSLKLYTIGFVASIILTLAAYIIVVDESFSDSILLVGIFIFAIVQLFVQLVFFLHIGDESKPRWNLMTLLFAGMVVLIVVIGSLWIMANLDYGMMMSPEETDKSIIEDELIKE